MEKIKIGDVCDILNGYAFKSENYVDSGIRIIRISNVQKGYIEDSTPAFYSFDTMGLSKFMLEEGDLLMSLTGNVGRVAILEKELLPAALNQRVACLRLKSNKITKSYLFHFLNSNFFEQQCIMASNGVAQKNMSTEWLKDYEIPLYTPNQQEEIVTVLNAAQSILSSRRQQLQKLDELIKARFVELFGDLESNPFDWPVCALKELVSIEPQNGLYKPQSAYVQDGSGFPIVRIDAFYNGRVTDFSALKRLECSESEVQRYLLQEDDIVINRVNSIEYLGKCAHIKGLLEETVFESNMMRLHLDDTVMNAVFATKLLCSQYMHKQIMIRAKKAVNQASINQQDVLSFRMFVPPLELQEQFAAFVEQTDKSKVVVQDEVNGL